MRKPRKTPRGVGDRLFQEFDQLPKPIRIIIVLGLLLIVGWSVIHPTILSNIITILLLVKELLKAGT